MQKILFSILVHILYITLLAYFYTIQLVCSVIIRIWGFFLRSMDIFRRSMIDCMNDLVDINKENIIFYFKLQPCALQTANGDAGLIVSGLFHKKQIGLFMAQTLNAKNRMVFWPLWQV